MRTLRAALTRRVRDGRVAPLNAPARRETHMQWQWRFMVLALLVPALGSANLCLAQSGDAAKGYPSRAVRMVNPSSPGGGADIIGRLVGQQLAKGFGETFITD